MTWIYRRNDQELRVEAQVGADDGHYVIRVVRPDGQERFEAFSEEGALRLRLTALESHLLEQQWIGSTGPIPPTDDGLRRSEPALPERRALTDRRRLTRHDRRSRGLAAVMTSDSASTDTRTRDDR